MAVPCASPSLGAKVKRIPELTLGVDQSVGEDMPISHRSGEMSCLALAEGKRMAQVVVHEVAHGLPLVIHVGAIL